MLGRIKHGLTFRLERMVMRAPFARLGIILGLVLAVEPGVESTGEAVWWAFLRLMAPGYRGDGQGIARAWVATADPTGPHVLMAL